ncbi:MAG: rhodanese-like domain-containing protein [Tissierellia bacterium]|nr:rhodanese-like domain-containing protein [Tissierellia bacterium]
MDQRKYKRLLLLALLLMLTACQSQSKLTKDSSSSEVNTIPGGKLDQIQEDIQEKEKYLVLDVRSPGEYQSGHLRHAINIPLDELQESMEILRERSEILITICNTQNRSSKAAIFLKGEGFDVLDAPGVKSYPYKSMVRHHNLLVKDFLTEAKDSEQIIDARSLEDYDKGHLKNAIPWEDIESLPSSFKKDEPLYIYCYAGNASGHLAEELVNEGFFAVYSCLDGTKESDQFELIKE